MWYSNKHVYKGLLIALISTVGAVLAVFCALAFILPKPTVSEAEKRELAKMPAFSWESLRSGSLTRDFEAFYADTFPFRDSFVRMASYIEEFYGIRYDDVRIVGVMPSLEDEPDEEPSPAAASTAPAATSTAGTAAPTTSGTTAPTGTTAPGTSSATAAPGTTAASGTAAASGTTAASSAEPSETTAPSGTTAPAETTEPTTAATEAPTEPTTTEAPTQPTTEQPTVSAVEQVDGLLILGDRAFEMFGGSRQQKYEYAKAVNSFASNFPGCRVYNLVVPSSVAFYLPEKYASYVADERANIADIYGALAPEVTSVDAYSVLEQHTAEYLYFRTDHHWTGLGAYYAYTAFAGQAGFAPRLYADYEKKTIEGFVGTLASASKDSKLREHPDSVEYCLVPVETSVQRWETVDSKPQSTTVLAEYAKGGSAYGVYLHGDCARMDITNLENPDGPVIVVLKESYGNAFAPYLIPHYGKVIVLDERQYTRSFSALVRDEGVDEILVINNVFAANTKNTTTNLNRLAGG